MTAILGTQREFSYDFPSYVNYTTKTKTNLIYLDPNNGNIRGNLNTTNTIIFSYNGSDTYINLGSNNTGIKAKIAFLTRLNNANNRDADITFVNSFFMHMFSNAKFRLGNNEIENIANVGFLVDVMNIIKGNYNDDTILDSNTGLADSRKCNNVGTLAANFVTNNPDYNKGYYQRKLRYNYTVAGNDDVREVEVFIPLSSIFGFCDCYDKVIKFTSIQIDLSRRSTAEKDSCIFGVDTSSMRLGDSDNTGLMNIQLVLEEIMPSPDQLMILEERIKQPVEINFLSRTCEMKSANQEQYYDIAETQFSNPHYVFVVARNNAADTAQRNTSCDIHADMQEVKVSLDGKDYPNISQMANFNNNIYSMFYQQFKEVCSKFNNNSPISLNDYKNLYTIYCTDLTAQPEKLTSGISNLRISMRRRAVPTADTDLRNIMNIRYYVIVLSEAKVSLDMLRKVCTKLK